MGRYAILVDDVERAVIPANSVEDALLKACCMFGIDVVALPEDSKPSDQYELFLDHLANGKGGKDGKG